MDDDLDGVFEHAMAGLAADGLPKDTPAGDLSHDALALALGEQYAEQWRHVDLWGHWYLWTGTHWQRDDKRRVWTKVRDFIRNRALGLDARAATRLRSAETIAAAVNLARSNIEFAAGVADWDRNTSLMGTPAGTINLRTGELRPARASDYITKLTAVAPAPPGADAPLWQAFLQRIFCHAPELIPFVQRSLGYALTGDNKEHAVFFAWGQGGNGKGVLLNTVSRMLGDYAAVAPQDLLLVTQSDRHPCDMAMLRGARFVTAQELGPGRAWDEPKLKSLTGGDPVTARFMHQNFFTYEPQFTMFVAGNHKPGFKGVDEAIRRRVLLLPFLQNIPAAERDPDLPEKLKAEWPAILRWTIDGCLEWQVDGLNPPACVRVATDDYLNAEDVLGQWLEDMCTVSPRLGWTSLSSLYGAWKIWCEARGQNPGTSMVLSRKLDERGFRREKRNTGAGFWGIAIVPKRDESDGSDATGDSERYARAHVYADNGGHRHYRHSAENEAEPRPEEQPPTDDGHDFEAEGRRRFGAGT